MCQVQTLLEVHDLRDFVENKVVEPTDSMLLAEHKKKIAMTSKSSFTLWRPIWSLVSPRRPHDQVQKLLEVHEDFVDNKVVDPTDYMLAEHKK